MMDAVQENDKALFDRIASQYARKDSIPSSREARAHQLEVAVAPILNGAKIDTIVEIACGIGAAAQYLEGRYERYVGVDYSLELIRHAREFHRGRSQIEFIVKNVKELTSADLPPADVVLAVGALHHFTEIDRVLSAITSVAKSGGFFVAIEPQSGNPIVQLLRGIRKKLDSGYSVNQHFFTEKEVRELLGRHNFTDINIEFEGYFSPPFAQIPIPPQIITYPLSRLASALDRWCGEHLPRFLKRLSWNIIIRARFPV